MNHDLNAALNKIAIGERLTRNGKQQICDILNSILSFTKIVSEEELEVEEFYVDEAYNEIVIKWI